MAGEVEPVFETDGEAVEGTYGLARSAEMFVESACRALGGVEAWFRKAIRLVIVRTI